MYNSEQDSKIYPTHEFHGSESELSIISEESCSTPDFIHEPSEGTLYINIRRKLHKVNRVSTSTLPAPRTPSKPGVYKETCIGRFAQIKALFDRRCPGSDKTSDNFSTSEGTCKKIQKSFTRKWERYLKKPITVTPQSLDESGKHSLFKEGVSLRSQCNGNSKRSCERK